MTNGYRHSHLAPEKGVSYDLHFSETPYRSMVWEFEKDILDGIMTNFLGNGEIDHFDFACGTGRILSHCMKRASTSVGVDVSPTMLDVTRKRQLHAEIIEADLTRDDRLGDRKFNLVTAFRFFPNAEPELRHQAMQVLVRHLQDDGYIVFNNHKHTGSSRNRLARLFGRKNFQGMSLQEAKHLLARNGLEVVRTYSLCIFPASESRMLVPRFLLRSIEMCLSMCSPLRNFGENLIFVCRRSATNPAERGGA